MRSAYVLTGIPDVDGDLYYATGFSSLDPVTVIIGRKSNKRYILASELEKERISEETQDLSFLSLEDYVQVAQMRYESLPSVPMALYAVLRDLELGKIIVPETFPVGWADVLRARGVEMDVKFPPFFESRSVKSSAELAHIKDCARTGEEIILRVREKLAAAVVRGETLYVGNEPLTSEHLQRQISMELHEKGFHSPKIIIACGLISHNPHASGSGPLRSEAPIVVDICLRSMSTFYWADICRTFVKGPVPDKVEQMYRAVIEAQRIAVSLVRDGIDGRIVHQSVAEHLDYRGFKTGTVDGVVEGFFHGTGHGVGLDVHEPPGIGRRSETLKSGQVVTLEPGLYYPDVGGVRIEDMFVIEGPSCALLTHLPSDIHIP
jgi:Xaa-Pro aminopeptidase